MNLLSWLNTYESPELMQHPDINVDVSKFESLLPEKTINELMDKYMRGVHTKFEEWLRNALQSESKEWRGSRFPEVDSEGGLKYGYCQGILAYASDCVCSVYSSSY